MLTPRYFIICTRSSEGHMQLCSEQHSWDTIFRTILSPVAFFISTTDIFGFHLMSEYYSEATFPRYLSPFSTDFYYHVGHFYVDFFHTLFYFLFQQRIAEVSVSYTLHFQNDIFGASFDFKCNLSLIRVHRINPRVIHGFIIL